MALVMVASLRRPKSAFAPFAVVLQLPRLHHSGTRGVQVVTSLDPNLPQAFLRPKKPLIQPLLFSTFLG